MKQVRARCTGKVLSGGGQLGQASLYQLTLVDGRVLLCDYIEIASDGFRTLEVGEEAWCTPSSDQEEWATYVVPIRDCSPLALLGLGEAELPAADPLAELWL